MDFANKEEPLLTALKHATMDWASANGLLVRTNEDAFTNCPVTLVPSLYPRQVYEEACNLATIFNRLIDRCSRDLNWLVETLQATAAGDDFIMRQIQICKSVNMSTGNLKKQTLQLGLNRSDYMIHAPPDSVSNVSLFTNVSDQGSFLQVELNTIASSFGGLSDKTCDLHRFLLKRYQEEIVQCYAFLGKRNFSKVNLSSLPLTENIEILSQGIAEAFKCYKNDVMSTESSNTSENAEKCVVFVIQEDETNTVDQRLLEYELFKTYGIPVMRRSLTNLSKSAEVIITEDVPKLFLDNGTKEVCVVYFRDGYSPAAYPTEAEWGVRELIESSYAIKCPTIPYQLVGAKKIQQVLSSAGVLEKFLSKEDVQKVRRCFAGLYEVNDDSIAAAIENPEHFVLKPQREGGGNNFYGQDIPKKLKQMSILERGAYILMQRIFPPAQNSILLAKGGQIKLSKALSELGIYGAYLGDGTTEHFNEKAGHLLRTKVDGVDEGGVASGFAVLDSPYVVG